MATPILGASALSFAYGERVLFENLSFSLEPGDKLGLIGDNGVGKSSLLKLITGTETPLSGHIALRTGATVEVLEQVPEFALDSTVRAILEDGLGARISAIHRWEAAVAALSPEADDLFAEIEHLGGFDFEHELTSIADSLDLPPMDRTVGTLSGGQRKRLAIARLVLRRPDVALFDEPTNHLDIETVEWLERWLTDTPTTCIVVTHDRAFLDRAVTHVAELRRPSRLVGAEAARGALAVYQGTYEDFLEQRAAEEAAREALSQSQAQRLKHELEWARRMPKARTTKSQARLDRVDALKGEVQALKAREAVSQIAFQAAPRLAKTVLALEDATFGYGPTPLVTGLNLALARGERLGVVGRNGIGKTSLLRALDGTLTLTAGRRVVGTETQIAVFDQHRTVLDPNRTIQETVAPEGNDTVFPGGKPTHVAAWLARFAFSARHLPMNVSALSGGERNRLALARFLLTPANVLLLDEPTNDLDLATLGVLEEALLAFSGTLVVVSHDRWFLDRIATRMLVFEELPPATPGGPVSLHPHLQPGDFTTYRRLRTPELDRLRQEHQAREREARAAERRPKTQPTGPEPKSGLSRMETRELQGLEAEVATLEEAVADLERQLADPSVWAGDGGVGQRLSDERDAKSRRLSAAMTRWEELAARA